MSSTSKRGNRSSSSTRIRFVHKSNLSGDSGPFQFPFQGLVSLLLLQFFPFEEFVCESEMGLYDDVQSSGANEAAVHGWEISTVKGDDIESRRALKVKAYYALGNERPVAFMTSAMQMVADLETPTRQCTSVAVPSCFPFSVITLVY